MNFNDIYSEIVQNKQNKTIIMVILIAYLLWVWRG